MHKRENNFAFIDGQNLNLGVQEAGWKLDYKRFRIYLKEKYKVKKAYIFIGYIKENKKLYQALRSVGYVLIFKPTTKVHNREIKGNVDAELVLQVMIDYKKYNKAVIITSDGDFYCLVKYLRKKNKLEAVIGTRNRTCSYLLKIAAKEKLRFINNLKNILEYKTPWC